MPTPALSHALFSTSLLAACLLSPTCLRAAPPALQATPAPAGSQPGAPATRMLGTVTATSAESITIKLESGGEARVDVTPQTKIVRTAPGEKTLTGATMIHVEDLTAGDRVSVRVAPGGDPAHPSATAIISMRQTDIAQAHATQAEDWQRRGVGGIVQTVQPDAAGGPTIVVGTSQPGRTLTIHVTPTTIIRRYAPDSVNFADAKVATLADVHAGDQLRARGDKNADGTEVTAAEIVSGSFRNVAGTITAIDASQNTVTVTDLATKKPVTLKLTAETQMRKLPPEMAQRLAARSSQGAGAAGPGASTGSAHAGTSGSGTPGTAGGGAPAGQPGMAASEAHPRGDTASMLQRAPAVTLAELKKGDAIMVVAARGGGGAADAATAITLIAGVEPLLQSSAGSASQNLFSASWNLGGGAAEATQ